MPALFAASVVMAGILMQAMGASAQEAEPSPERSLHEHHLSHEILGGLLLSIPTAFVGGYFGCQIYVAGAEDEPHYDGCTPGWARGGLVGLGIGFGLGVIAGGYNAGAQDGWWQTLLATVLGTAGVLALTYAGIRPDIMGAVGIPVLVLAPLITFELTVQ